MYLLFISYIYGMYDKKKKDFIQSHEASDKELEKNQVIWSAPVIPAARILLLFINHSVKAIVYLISHILQAHTKAAR